MKRTGLGKGLESIFADNYNEKPESKTGDGISKIKLSQIEVKSDQPRKYFNTEALEALADSISQHGVLQPILVRLVESGFYQIIAGERRYRAAKMAGLSEIPAIIIDADDLKTAEIALIENLQREDLNPYEEAQAYASLMRDFGLTQEELSARIGKSRSAIANTLRLLDLPDDVLEMLKTGDISAGHARTLLGLKNKDAIVDVALKILESSLSVRDTEALVKKLNRLYELSEQDPEPETIKVDYVGDLERRARELLGRQIKIKAKGKSKVVQIEFNDNEDLEELLVKLCGKGIIEGVL
ncbi:MAG: ParB/RepB/Spo0J family partition protein [Clostridia bacterium]|nr:ParB/RepB/Spo0J family partition protein [Clostridia bacterium]MBR2296601.1 ParB/RepB/Spo0J family partition protein [Clostridia bacterium]